MAPNRDLIEAVVTCTGNLHDPDFQLRFHRWVDKLKTLINLKNEEQPFIKKVEPWNSVRVTISIPKEAAQRLRLLAQDENGANALRSLGILSVQVEDDQVISLTLRGENNEPQQVFLGGNEEAGTSSSASSNSSISSTCSSSTSFSNNSVNLNSNNSNYHQPISEVSVPLPLGILSSPSTSGFRSPNVIAPSGASIPVPPKNSVPPGGSGGIRTQYPFVSMIHAANALQIRNEPNSSTVSPSSSSSSIVINNPQSTNNNNINNNNNVLVNNPPGIIKQINNNNSNNSVVGLGNTNSNNSSVVGGTLSNNNPILFAHYQPHQQQQQQQQQQIVSISGILNSNSTATTTSISNLDKFNSNHHQIANFNNKNNAAISQASPSQSLQLHLVNVPSSSPYNPNNNNLNVNSTKNNFALMNHHNNNLNLNQQQQSYIITTTQQQQQAQQQQQQPAGTSPLLINLLQNNDSPSNSSGSSTTTPTTPTSATFISTPPTTIGGMLPPTQTDNFNLKRFQQQQQRQRGSSLDAPNNNNNSNKLVNATSQSPSNSEPPSPIMSGSLSNSNDAFQFTLPSTTSSLESMQASNNNFNSNNPSISTIASGAGGGAVKVLTQWPIDQSQGQQQQQIQGQENFRILPPQGFLQQQGGQIRTIRIQTTNSPGGTPQQHIIMNGPQYPSQFNQQPQRFTFQTTNINNQNAVPIQSWLQNQQQVLQQQQQQQQQGINSDQSRNFVPYTVSSKNFIINNNQLNEFIPSSLTTTPTTINLLPIGSTSNLSFSTVQSLEQQQGGVAKNNPSQQPNPLHTVLIKSMTKEQQQQLPQQLTSTGKPRQFLINPLTGHLEPMPSESSSESDESGGNNEDGSKKKKKKPKVPLTSSIMMSRKGKPIHPQHIQNILKQQQLPISTVPLKDRLPPPPPSNQQQQQQPTSGEKIKLRLKLNEKNEPVVISPSIVSDVVQGTSGSSKKSSLNVGAPSSTSTLSGLSGISTPTSLFVDQLRVPPLHISLRGRNAAVVVKDDKQSLESSSLTTTTSVENTTMTTSIMNKQITNYSSNIVASSESSISNTISNVSQTINTIATNTSLPVILDNKFMHVNSTVSGSEQLKRTKSRLKSSDSILEKQLPPQPSKITRPRLSKEKDEINIHSLLNDHDFIKNVNDSKSENLTNHLPLTTSSLPTSGKIQKNIRRKSDSSASTVMMSEKNQQDLNKPLLPLSSSAAIRRLSPNLLKIKEERVDGNLDKTSAPKSLDEASQLLKHLSQNIGKVEDIKPKILSVGSSNVISEEQIDSTRQPGLKNVENIPIIDKAGVLLSTTTNELSENIPSSEKGLKSPKPLPELLALPLPNQDKSDHLSSTLFASISSMSPSDREAINVSPSILKVKTPPPIKPIVVAPTDLEPQQKSASSSPTILSEQSTATQGISLLNRLLTSDKDTKPLILPSPQPQPESQSENQNIIMTVANSITTTTSSVNYGGLNLDQTREHTPLSKIEITNEPKQNQVISADSSSTSTANQHDIQQNLNPSNHPSNVMEESIISQPIVELEKPSTEIESKNIEDKKDVDTNTNLSNLVDENLPELPICLPISSPSRSEQQQQKNSNNNTGNGQCEDSGIDSMDSEKSPNQGESPVRKECMEHHNYCDTKSIQNQTDQTQPTDEIKQQTSESSNIPSELPLNTAEESEKVEDKVVNPSEKVSSDKSNLEKVPLSYEIPQQQLKESDEKVNIELKNSPKLQEDVNKIVTNVNVQDKLSLRPQPSTSTTPVNLLTESNIIKDKIPSIPSDNSEKQDKGLESKIHLNKPVEIESTTLIVGKDEEVSLKIGDDDGRKNVEKPNDQSISNILQQTSTFSSISTPIDAKTSESSLDKDSQIKEKESKLFLDSKPVEVGQKVEKILVKEQEIKPDASMILTSQSQSDEKKVAVEKDTIIVPKKEINTQHKDIMIKKFESPIIAPSQLSIPKIEETLPLQLLENDESVSVPVVQKELTTAEILKTPTPNKAKSFLSKIESISQNLQQKALNTSDDDVQQKQPEKSITSTSTALTTKEKDEKQLETASAPPPAPEQPIKITKEIEAHPVNIVTQIAEKIVIQSQPPQSQLVKMVDIVKPQNVSTPTTILQHSSIPVPLPVNRVNVPSPSVSLLRPKMVNSSPISTAILNRTPTNHLGGLQQSIVNATNLKLNSQAVFQSIQQQQQSGGNPTPFILHTAGGPIKVVTLPKQSAISNTTITTSGGGNITNRSSPLLDAVNLMAAANQQNRSDSPGSGIIQQTAPLNLSSGPSSIQVVSPGVSNAAATADTMKLIVSSSQIKMPSQTQIQQMQQNLYLKPLATYAYQLVRPTVNPTTTTSAPTTIEIKKPIISHPTTISSTINVNTSSVPVISKSATIPLSTATTFTTIASSVVEQKSADLQIQSIQAQKPIQTNAPLASAVSVTVSSKTKTTDSHLPDSICTNIDGSLLDTGSPGINEEDLPFDLEAIIHDEKDLADVLAGEEIVINGIEDHSEGENDKVFDLSSSNAKPPVLEKQQKIKSEILNANGPLKEPESPILSVRSSSPLYTYSSRSARNSTSFSSNPSSIRSTTPTPTDDADLDGIHGEDQEIIDCLSGSKIPRLNNEEEEEERDKSMPNLDKDGEMERSDNDEDYDDEMQPVRKKPKLTPATKFEEQLSIEIPPVEIITANSLNSPKTEAPSDKKPIRSTRSNTRLVSPDITAFRSDTPKLTKFSSKLDSFVIKNSPKPSPTGVKLQSPSQQSNSSNTSSRPGSLRGSPIPTTTTTSTTLKSKSVSATKRKRQESDSSNDSKTKDDFDEKTTATVEIDLNSRPGKRRCSENAAELIKACIGIEDTPKRNTALVNTALATAKKELAAKELAAAAAAKKQKMMTLVEESDEDLDATDLISRGRGGSRCSSEDRSSSRGSSVNRSTSNKDDQKESKTYTSRSNNRTQGNKKTGETGGESPHSNSSMSTSQEARVRGRRSNRDGNIADKLIPSMKSKVGQNASSSFEKGVSSSGNTSASNSESDNPRRKTRSSVHVNS